MRALRPAVAAVSAALALSGCSQIHAIAPTGGDRLAEVRTAGNDVLLDHKIAVMVAPACTVTGRSVTCRGTTIDNRVISVSSSADDQDIIVISVGDQVIFRGSITHVLTDHGRAPS